MKYEKIDDRARVWTISRGTDGCLMEELDEGILATLDPMADALVIAAGEQDIAENRAW
ncbi:MAG TPA: hypothetical protein VF067_05575 [Sphingomicrobium sp.]